MIVLLWNLKLSPASEIDYRKLPLSTEKAPTDDLIRIKYYRNKYAHSDDGNCNPQSFIDDWEDIIGVRMHCIF